VTDTAGPATAAAPGPALHARGPGPEWVDTHCHLHLAAEEAGTLLDRAGAAGVAWVVSPATDAASSQVSAALARAHAGRVVPTAGLHPHAAADWPAERDEIARLAADAAAVGECGLDFYRTLSPPEAQKAAFADQLALAAELDKPVIVHCRDAFADVHDMLDASGWAPRAVLHCWTGGPRWTRRFAELGVTFSFAGPVAFDTGDTVRRGAAAAPPERTMVETDTPYLTPPPRRGEPNEPANVVAVGAALAGVWGVEVAEVARLTTAAARGAFGHD
jgi:TatD DNase family protein